MRDRNHLFLLSLVVGFSSLPALGMVWVLSKPALSAVQGKSVRPDDTLFLAIHRDAVVADGHNDALTRTLGGEDLSIRTSRGHTDLARLREGGLDVQVFALYVNPSAKNPFRTVLRMLDTLHALAKRAGRILRVTRTSGEIQQAAAEGVIAAVASLEGGHAVGLSYPRILELYRRGVRIFGPTWSRGTPWASSSQEEAAGKRRGLTASGKRLVRAIDSLGMLIDISHAGPKTVEDILDIVHGPVIASHSSCAALCPSERNLTDAQIRALARRGGVVMINFCPGFLRSGGGSDAEAIRSFQRRLQSIGSGSKRFESRALEARDSLIAEARRRGLPTILDVADHIDHAVRIAGDEHVGLGSDFDGIDLTPVGLADVADLPFLTRELLRRGYPIESIRRILGGNLMRVFHEQCR
ncbi:MAG: dipeptidase [Bacteroidota bacterium]|nr:dipeptidase [Bacteroidota bacterium]